MRSNLLVIAGFLCTIVLTTGCGCNQNEVRNLAPTPGTTPSQIDTNIKAEDPVNTQSGRSMSIAESAFVRSPNDGPGKKKRSLGTAAGPAHQMNGDFDRKYTKGVEMMEKGSYGDAMKMFEEILTQFPDTEEASVAEYCIAEIHFRNKSNQLALQAFQHIVEKYPDSPAAQNAKEGIEYLSTFEENEKNYVSPEVEDRQRRGL